MSATYPPVILMLEYDLDDRLLVRSVFDEFQYKAHLEFVNTGVELFTKMEQCRAYGLRYPSLILVNINSTPQDGRAVLKQLKNSTDYKHVPVVIISGLQDEKMAKECYALGASSFIQKPDRLSETNKKISNFFRYWFETVGLS